MQIKFTRSGGFAGAATNVSGTVQWADSGGVQVTSEGTEYRRDLAAAEAEQLQNGADPSALTLAKRASSASPARDAYQYDITVITRDGKTHPFTFTGGASSEALKTAAPAAASLLSWVEEETQKIWAHRVNTRK